MSYELFEQEQSVLQAAEDRLRDIGDGVELSDDYRSLLDEYKRLFKQVRRLVRISDRTEAELRDTQLDLRERTRLMELMHNVVGSANTAREPREAMQTCLSDVCAFVAAPFARAWLVVGETESHLSPANVWHADDSPRYAKLAGEVGHVTAGEGLIGRCLQEKAVLWSSNLTDDLVGLPDGQDGLAEIESAVAVPVMIGDEAVAVLEFLLPGSAAPETTLIWALEGLGLQIGRVFERKHAEAEITDARDAAQAAAEAKASFLAAMSHEIRTPMNGVIGMVDLLTATKLDSDQRHMVRTVRNSAQSLLTIINDILDFSKIEAGKLEVEQVPISVPQIVEEVTDTLVPLATDKGIRIVSFIDPDIPAQVIGDAVRVRQILLNLGSNAVKFTANEDDQPGTVTIRADAIANESNAGAMVRLSVADTGIGMSPEAVGNLFKPFVQAERSTTRRFGGTGLGLSICRQLVDLMEGEIAVESELGAGSTFSVTLPMAIDGLADDAAGTKPLEGVRALVASADADTAQFIERYLAHWGVDTELSDVAGLVASDITGAIGSANAIDVVLVNHSEAMDIVEAIIAQQSKDEAVPAPTYLVFSRDRNIASAKRSSGVTVVATDPLHPSALLRGLEVATGRAEPDAAPAVMPAGGPAARAPSIEEAERLGELILVAEDNPTNQDVIQRQLGLLGYAAEMTDDGAAAFAAWQAQRHAILLTDCHMPEMDGFALTAAIRKTEKPGDRRFPIVAITADALQGEAQRCLDAGMDDYLTKPLDMEKLRAVLAKWLPKREDAAASDQAVAADAQEKPGPGGAAGADGQPVNLAALTDLFGDDPDTVREILRDFIAPSEAIVVEFESAYASRESAGIVAAAHKLKSSSRAVGADRLADLCQDLETAGKASDWDEIDRQAPQLKELMAVVTEFIDQM